MQPLNYNWNISGSSVAGFGGLAVIFSMITAILYVLLNVLLMRYVWLDGQKLEQNGRGTVVLTPFTWGLAALLMGLLAVGLYWLAHYSIFAYRGDVQANREPAPLGK